MLTYHEANATAAPLIELMKNGQLADAYSYVRRMDNADLGVLMLAAGFSVGDFRRADFRREAQSNIARACANRTDGFGLRKLDETAPRNA